MKSIISNTALKIVVLMAVLVGSNAIAQESSEEIKIAVLDMGTALFNSDRAKEVDQSVRAETAEDQEKIRALAQEAEVLQQRLQQDAAIMSEEEQRSIAEDIQEIGVQYQFLVEKVQTLVEQRRQQFQQTYAPNLIDAITAVVEEDGYDLVIRAEAILHYRSVYDITAKVTEKLNQP